MLIPQRVFNIVHCAYPDADRESIHGVYLYRAMDDRPHAVATNGKVLCEVVWKEEDLNNIPSILKGDFTPSDGMFAITVPYDIARKLSKLKLPKKFPALQNIAIDEHDMGSFTFQSYDLDSLQQIKCHPVEERFPAYTDILHNLDRAATGYVNNVNPFSLKMGMETLIKIAKINNRMSDEEKLVKSLNKKDMTMYSYSDRDMDIVVYVMNIIEE